MRIAYISSSIIPSRFANSVHVMKMCQAFAKNGHDVTLFAPDVREQYEKDVPDEYAFYGVDRCFDIIKLPWRRIKGRGYLYGVNAAIQAKKLVPDLVYCRNTPGCYFSALLGWPVVFESHSPIDDEKKALKRSLFSFIGGLPSFKKLVVITHSLKLYYETFFPAVQGKVFVASDGADPVSESVEAAQLPGCNDRLRVGYVGHLYQGRGMEVLLALAERCSWANFHIIGGNQEDISFWKKQFNRRENVFFHGFVAPEKAEAFRIACDVLLAPYQNAVAVAGGGGNTVQWMSPLKIFEYMAARKGIIASDLPVLHEVLQHERNALLCPFDDVDAWERALIRLNDDAVLRRKLAENAFSCFIKKHTWSARARAILDNYLST